MAVAAVRRLPGVGFEVQAPQPVEVLPCMDVAVFVGFASSGPLHLPVDVEDVAEFTKIFGPDAPLAWDRERGEQVFAYLGPAVRAFFQNGGRRCWIIRVADEQRAESNFFPIPALARAVISETGEIEEIAPAFARARSEGSWSDALSAGSGLLSETVEVLEASLQESEEGTTTRNLVAMLSPSSPSDVARGDLLRLTFPQQGYVLMTPIQAIEAIDPQGGGAPPIDRRRGRTLLRVTGGSNLWFRTSATPDALSPVASATVFTFGPDSSLSSITVRSWSVSEDDQIITLVLDCPFEQSPDPGSVLRADVGTSTLWFTVEERTTSAQDGSPPAEAVEVRGHGLWILDAPPEALPDEITRCEVLSFELWVRQSNLARLKLSELAFAQGHRFFWGSLPTDGRLYKGRHAVPKAPRPTLWEMAAEPRFPLAGSKGNKEIYYLPGAGWINAGEDGSEGKRELYFPVAMPFIPRSFLGPLKTEKSPLERDGLGQFDERLFLDEDLMTSRLTDLVSQADFLRYQSPTPRSLRGIHAALEIEEATILAIPDAVHRGWYYSSPETPPEPEKLSPLSRPHWWHFLNCDPKPTIPLSSEPGWGNFLHCGIRVLSAPLLEYTQSSKQSGTFTLFWSRATDPDATYILEEWADPGPTGSSVTYAGPEVEFTVYGRSHGRYYFRVRLEVGNETSDWSNAIVIQVAPQLPWMLSAREKFDVSIPLSVHRAALRMSAARGDIFTVLTLPAHFREEESITYVSTLKSTVRSNGRTESVEPLGFGETSAFSFGAVYHPWLISWDGLQRGTTRIGPADGAVCGMMARRSLLRGAWIAPSNESLKGVLSLTPAISQAWRLRFQDEQINLIWQEPRGFVCLNGDTLSTNEDLRPINVRRLLMLLRRLALRLGASYVFEPNDSAFQRRVRRGFEAMLDYMYVRGAFKGKTPEAAYQVVTDSAVNTAQSMEEGRFIVELRVAPSLPMRFLTVRLVQTGERTLVAIEQ
jgi:hypothetical protein